MKSLGGLLEHVVGRPEALAAWRGVVREPDVLLLDEPTNHLDVEAIELVASTLRS